MMRVSVGAQDVPGGRGGHRRRHRADTPCLRSRTLSDITGAEVVLKFENHQFTASFKERGALNRLLALGPEERARGVCAPSAGNHAQGVAYHAARLGIPATIVMPRFTPGVKVSQTRALGAQVVLHGETFDEARAHAEALVERARPDADPPLRRPAGDRRAGDGGAGDAGGVPRSGRAGGAGGRRRACWRAWPSPPGP